jgi:hypothetical protein
MATRTPHIAVAINVAEPRSSRVELGSRHRRSGDLKPGQKSRPGGDPGDDELPVTPYVDRRLRRRDGPSHGGSVVAAGGQSDDFSGGVDTAHLHRDRGEARETHCEHGDQRRDPESRFDGGESGVVI